MIKNVLHGLPISRYARKGKLYILYCIVLIKGSIKYYFYRFIIVYIQLKEIRNLLHKLNTDHFEYEININYMGIFYIMR